MTPSSSLAGEGRELQAAVSYTPLPLLGQEIAKVGGFGCVFVCFTTGRFVRGFFHSWLEKEEPNRRIFVTSGM